MVQMQVTDQVEVNVQKAIDLIKEAAKSKPDVIVLPENFHLMTTKQDFFDQAETIDGPTITRLKELAKELDTYIVAGTMKLKEAGEAKLKNICCVINSEGEIQDIYNKVHTFNAQVGDVQYQGSQVEEAGNRLIVTTIKGVPVGLSVCFDIRFPEMFRIFALKGAKVILVPAISCFTLVKIIGKSCFVQGRLKTKFILSHQLLMGNSLQMISGAMVVVWRSIHGVLSLLNHPIEMMY